MSETTPLHRLNANDSLDHLASRLYDSGAIIVEDILSSATLSVLRNELEPHIQAADPAMRQLNDNYQSFFGNRTRNVAAVSAKSPTFANTVLPHPILVGLAERVLGPNCNRFLLSSAQVIVPEPGMERQYIHRDDSGWIHVPRPHPELLLGVLIALDDFTAENGATCMVPGSHRWPLDREPEESEIHPAIMRGGSAVVYLGSTLHAAGANRSHTLRRGLHVSYLVGWLRTEENHFLAVPLRDVQRMPKRSQELLGYAIHDASKASGGIIGHVDMRDPGELLLHGKLPTLS